MKKVDIAQVTELVNEFAQAVKMYGLGLGKEVSGDEMTRRIVRAEKAQEQLKELGFDVTW